MDQKVGGQAMVLRNHHTRMLRRRCRGRAYVIYESSKTRNAVTPWLRPGLRAGQANRKARCGRYGARCWKKRRSFCNGRNIGLMAFVARAYIARPVRVADVRQVLLWERVWRIFEGWNANDGVSRENSWCPIRPSGGLELHQLETGSSRRQKTAGPQAQRP